jgi:hypothetical protein
VSSLCFQMGQLVPLHNGLYDEMEEAQKKAMEEGGKPGGWRAAIQNEVARREEEGKKEDKEGGDK